MPLNTKQAAKKQPLSKLTSSYRTWKWWKNSYLFYENSDTWVGQHVIKTVVAENSSSLCIFFPCCTVKSVAASHVSSLCTQGVAMKWSWGMVMLHRSGFAESGGRDTDALSRGLMTLLNQIVQLTHAITLNSAAAHFSKCLIESPSRKEELCKCTYVPNSSFLCSSNKAIPMGMINMEIKMPCRYCSFKSSCIF